MNLTQECLKLMMEHEFELFRFQELILKDLDRYSLKIDHRSELFVKQQVSRDVFDRRLFFLMVFYTMD